MSRAAAPADQAGAWLVEVNWRGADEGWWVVSIYRAESGARNEVRILRGHYYRKGQRMRVREDST